MQTKMEVDIQFWASNFGLTQNMLSYFLETKNYSQLLYQWKLNFGKKVAILKTNYRSTSFLNLEYKIYAATLQIWTKKH